MTILFVILIVIASVALSLIVLIQNPKGGGLSGSIAGFSNQFMGVKQTTDVLEKGTWVMAILIALLTIAAPMFIGGTSSGVNEPNLRPNATQQQAPAPALPQQPAPLPAQQP